MNSERKGMEFFSENLVSSCLTTATEMKCVGIFFLVLLVKLLRNDFWDNTSSKIARPSFAYEPFKKLNFDDFRSKLNTTEWIWIPDSLLLTDESLSGVSSNVLASFRSLQQTLSELSDCSSKTLSSVATDLFALLDKRANRIGSLNEDSSSLSDALPEVFLSINDVLTRLNIGTSINEGVSDLETNLLNVIQVLSDAKVTDSNITQKFNNVVFAMAGSLQVLINDITQLAEAAMVKIVISSEAKEMIISLTLILETVIVLVQSSAASIASIAFSTPDRIMSTSSVLHSFLWIVDSQLPALTNGLPSITPGSIVSSMSAIVSTISVTLTSFSYRINQLLEKLQTSVLVQVSNKLETIFHDVVGSDTDFTRYISTSAATLLSGVAAISSSDSGIQSKICRRLYPLLRSMTQLTGSDDKILAEFANSLSTISEIFKEVSFNLVFGIGVELTKSIIESIQDVFDALQNTANLLIQNSNIDAMKMDNVTVECAKTVQILGSTIPTVTETIYRSISHVSEAALECVIALPILHSIVLYLAEWMTILASSVTLTQTGTTHELVSSLAVTIAAILQHFSSIVEIIAVSSNQNATQIVRLIASPIMDREKSSASIIQISKAEISATIDVMTSSSESHGFVVEGIDSTNEGKLSDLMNDLTGSLSFISSSFSSSLSSLQKSVKQIASYKIVLLQTFCVALNSITTDLSNLSGTATQILNVTVNSLHSIFGRLLHCTTKLTEFFGDIVTSLVKSIANISAALHSLFYAISDFKVSTYYLNDSIRELTQTVQILISTFAAIIHSAANTTSDILEKLAVEVATLPYLVLTVILVVQQVLGATIPSVSAVTGSITFIQHNLILSLSSILDNLTSITTDVTVLLTDDRLNEVASEIVSSVSNLQEYSTASLSRISGTVANIQVTLSLAV